MGHLDTTLVLDQPEGQFKTQFGDDFQLLIDPDDKLFTADDVSSLAVHASNVLQQFIAMRRNALQMCVSLTRCKQAYDVAQSKKYPNRTRLGWEKFCDTNFKQLGLSLPKIRNCISIGSKLIDLQINNPKAFQNLERLSLSALLSIGQNDEIIGDVQVLLEQNPDEKITKSDILNLKELLREKDATLDQLRIALNRESENKKTIETVSADLNERLLMTESEVQRLKVENQGLVKQAATPVESLVPVLPKGVKNEAEYLDQLKTENQQKSSQLQKTNEDLLLAQEKLTGVQRLLAEQSHGIEVLEALVNDVKGMSDRHTQALLHKVNASPKTKEKLNEIAKRLHFLADQIAS